MEEHIQPNESFRLSWDIPPRRSVELGAFFNIQLCLRTETGIKATRQVFEDLFLLPIEGNNGSNDYFAVHLDNPILTVTLVRTNDNEEPFPKDKSIQQMERENNCVIAILSFF